MKLRIQKQIDEIEKEILHFKTLRTKILVKMNILKSEIRRLNNHKLLLNTSVRIDLT
jgi:hypothetical protein